MLSDKNSGLMEILRESIKILPRNVGLFAFTALVYSLLFFISSYFKTISSVPVIQDLVAKASVIPSMKPGSAEYVDILAGMRKDACVFLVVNLAVSIVNFFTSSFAITATISISSMSYNSNNLSLKDLVSRLARPWARLTVTSFQVMLLVLGYSSFLFILFVIPILLLLDGPLALVAVVLVFFVLIVVFFLHLSVVWVLASVISVMEESCGLGALGKAAVIAKGKRRQGFLLNLLLFIAAIISLGVTNKNVLGSSSISALLQACFTCLLNMFQVIAYTVLYFQCMVSKKSLEYNLVPTTPQDIP